MRCPAWPALLEHRFDPSLPEPEGWADAVEHLDTCTACRRQAEDIDPTLIFRHLPVPVLGGDEIADMKLAVHTLRTTSALKTPSTGERFAARFVTGLDPRHGAAWKVAAAALLAAGVTASVSLPPELQTAPRPQAAAVHPETSPAAQRPDRVPLWAYGGVEEAGTSAGQDAPVVEGVVSPDARVYSFPSTPDEQVAVVMVIDPTLDV